MMTDDLTSAVRRQPPSDTRLRALHAYYVVDQNKSQIAATIAVAKTTIANWINLYEHDGVTDRRVSPQKSLKFTGDQTSWIIQEYDNNSLLYLSEVRDSFEKEFGETISAGQVWSILNRAGYTRKAGLKKHFDYRI
jgi:transposase